MKTTKIPVVFALSLITFPLSQAVAQQKGGLVLGTEDARSATTAITEQATQTPGDIYRGTVFGADKKQYASEVLGDRALATKKLVYDTSLIRAIKIEDVDRVRTLMYANVSANEKNYAGITPLTVAGEKGNLDILKLLVENGKADVNDKSSYGVTPLIAAAAAGKGEAISYLLAHGADATAKDDLGKTALIYASNYDDPKTLSKLLSLNKLAVNIPDNSGNTPLIYSAQKGLLNNVKTLLAAGAKADYRSPVTGVSALAAASAEGHMEVIRQLVKVGKADVNLRDLAGRTPIFYAVERNQPQALQLLLSLGADPNTKDNAGVTALMRASAKNYVDCQKILLRQKGIDVNAKDTLGRNAVTYGVYAPDVDIVQNLVSAKANINNVDLQGNTPLINAIKAKNDRTAVFLIQQDANLTMANQAGETAFTLAPVYLPNSGTTRVLGVKQPRAQQQALQVEAAKLAEVRDLEEQLAKDEQRVQELKAQAEVAQTDIDTAKPVVAATVITAEEVEVVDVPAVATEPVKAAAAPQKPAAKARTGKTNKAQKGNTAKRRRASSSKVASPKGERIPKASVAPKEVNMADFLKEEAQKLTEAQ